MSDNKTTKKPQKGGKYNGNMKVYTLRLPPSLLDAAKEQAGMVELPRIIRALIRMWIAGEIDRDDLEKYDQ
jgi:hypothetical protein